MPTTDPRAYLWKNLCRLMRTDKPSLDAVQLKTGVGRGTIQRIQEGAAAPRLDSLQTIAEAFKIEVWQLLVPDLDPDALPTISTPDANSQALEARVAKLEQSLNARPFVPPEKRDGTHG